MAGRTCQAKLIASLVVSLLSLALSRLLLLLLLCCTSAAAIDKFRNAIKKALHATTTTTWGPWAAPTQQAKQVRPKTGPALWTSWSSLREQQEAETETEAYVLP